MRYERATRDHAAGRDLPEARPGDSLRRAFPSWLRLLQNAGYDLSNLDPKDAETVARGMARSRVELRGAE